MAVEARRTPLSERQIEYMMTTFIRHKGALMAVRDSLKPDSFARHHAAYAALWSVVCDYVDEFNELPDADTTVGELERRFDEDPDAISAEEHKNLDDFMYRAHAVDASRLNPHIVRVARKYLREYLEDRLADRLRDDLTSSLYVPRDMCGLLAAYQTDFTRIASVAPAGIALPFPPGWDQAQTAVPKSTTGLDFLNKMLNGGQAPKEVYGIVGPHGSCKTLIGIQYGTLQASMLYREWLASGKKGPLKTVYTFVYESDIAEMRLRALSSLGQIDRNVLETGDWNQLSTPETLKPYERKLFAKIAAGGSQIRCERQRCRDVAAVLNHNWRVIDMTGNDQDHPGRGVGLIDEIVSIIQADQDYQRQQGVDCAVGPIVIDYAGAAVKRHLGHLGKDYSRDLRHYLTDFPMQCKNKLALRYATTVLALHQLSGEANDQATGTIPKSTNAAESRSWRENLDFSFAIGNPDKKKGLVIFSCDKHRRAPGAEHVILQIQGRLSRVAEDTRYAIDHVRKQIVDKRDLRTIEDEDDHRPPVSDDDLDDGFGAETKAIQPPRKKRPNPETKPNLPPGRRRADDR